MEGYHSRCPHVNTLIATHQHKPGHLVIPIRCKRWTCRYCARVNLRRLIHRVKDGHPNKFITLTCHRKPGDTPESIYASHRPQIRKLIAMIRATFGTFEAAILCEKHKSGYPHWHLVARSNFIPHQVLRAWWQKLTGSSIVDIRKIDNLHNTAHYVAKYVTKTAGHNRPDWCKRVYQFTQHYAKVTKRLIDPDIIFERVRKHPQEVLEYMQPNFERCEDIGGHWALWNGDIGDTAWLFDCIPSTGPPEPATT